MRAVRHITRTTSLALAIIIIASSTAVYADDATPVSTLMQAPVLISEVQAGSAASASEEFIELYNTTGADIDFSAHAWQLEIASSTATSWASPLRSVALSGVIASGGHYIVASQFTSGGVVEQYLSGSAAQWFSAGISAAAGHVRLSYTTNQTQSDGTCSAAQTVDDEIEWSAPKTGAPATPSIDGRSVFVTLKTTGLPAGNSLQRQVDPGMHLYADTNSDATDFMLATLPSPGVANAAAAATVITNWQAAVPPAADGCDPAPAPAPSADGAPADPGAPSVLQPPVSSPPVAGDGAGDTSLPAQDSPPDSAPTVLTPSIPAADVGLLGPQLSELLPNPAPPGLDASDEFIELYNPNPVVFDLSGFRLQVGLGTLHQYTFPAGTQLPALSFVGFYSATTKLSLSNSGSQAKLLDPRGATVVVSDAYGVAKDGQAWVFANNTWQWTTAPTPGVVNVVRRPAVALKKPSATQAKSAVKGAKTTKAATTKKKSNAKPAVKKLAATTTAATTPVGSASAPSQPLHLTVLAVIVALAVLYGAYEYRSDVANYYQRVFRNRSARREARRSSPRRRGD
ncbi:MAG TPA: lamin tail domain-containing protein [Patescibacteria group bacterium]|nr:lamin tail domain-containing protein [Patescibacteria group bacterium]